MAENSIPPVVISANDRLFFTVFIAVIFHGLIILGITFSQQLFKDKVPPTLDVIIVNNANPTEKLIDKADFIANANQNGGGDTDRNAHIRSPFTAFEQSDSFGIAPIPIRAATKISKTLEFQDIISTVSQSSHNVARNKEKKQKKEEDSKEKTTFEHNLEMAQLMNEISDSLDKHAKRPRKSFINTRTKSAVSAQYMHNWIKKIERIGNLNYPEKARKSNLTGNLVLVVAINKDGSIFNLKIRQSSGSSILDLAAKNIVTMAAPFAQFGEKLAKSVDILYITRTWQFQSNQLSSK